jgi:hypothetical protein
MQREGALDSRSLRTWIVQSANGARRIGQTGLATEIL